MVAIVYECIIDKGIEQPAADIKHSRSQLAGIYPDQGGLWLQGIDPTDQDRDVSAVVIISDCRS